MEKITKLRQYPIILKGTHLVLRVPFEVYYLINTDTIFREVVTKSSNPILD